MEVSTPYQYFQFAKENTQTKKKGSDLFGKGFSQYKYAHLHSAKVSENKKRANIGVADQ